MDSDQVFDHRKFDGGALQGGTAPKHESAGNEVTADGIVHRCSCGWVSPPCFSNAVASCLGIDHRAQAKPTNGEG